jgi:hypothetical protein
MQRVRASVRLRNTVPFYVQIHDFLDIQRSLVRDGFRQPFPQHKQVLRGHEAVCHLVTLIPCAQRHASGKRQSMHCLDQLVHFRMVGSCLILIKSVGDQPHDHDFRDKCLG